MSYSALYRKLRPTRFSELYGQEHIVRTLGNQLKTGRISHAYMFCGIRGTGKTTTARLFARAINCENPADGDACGKCSFCLLPEENLSSVVIEIDAASNNKVENVRDISDEVAYLPPFGKYRVYVIDEVHMLTPQAFNALLKTLEEPPAHVVFIFASTEPQKIPVTIHSRCQRFDFKRISSDDIASALKVYMEAEGVAVTGQALKYVARAADGAMRDALSILDQCISFYYNEEINLEKVTTLLGAVDDSALCRLADYLFARNAEACMGEIDSAVNLGRDLLYMAEELAGYFRDIMVVKSVGDRADVSPERLADLRRQAGEMDLGSVIAYARAFSELSYSMKYSSNRRLLFELECIKLCNTLSTGAPVDVLSRLDALEHGLKTLPPAPIAEAAKQTKTLSPKAEAKTPTPEKKPAPALIDDVLKNWNTLVSEVGDVMLKAMLQKAKPGHIEGDVFSVVCPNPGILDYLKTKPAELKTLFAGSQDISVSLILESEYNERQRLKSGAAGSGDSDDDDSAMDMLSKILNV